MLRPILALVMMLGSPLWADPESKFRVEGDRLIYDTENVPEGTDDEIDDDDLEILKSMLRDAPGVTVLELNSNGGSVWAGDRMAEVVIDYGLDTHVNGACVSSCVTVFLGGASRTMSRGSRIGFHQTYWSADSMERYFDRDKEFQKWETPFDFSEWLYSDTQDEVYQRLVFMMRRGVDPAFAIETLKKGSNDTWVPWRVRLLAAGVLTE